MPIPLALAAMGVSALGGAAQNLINKPQNMVPDPRQYKDQILMNEQDLMGIRSNALDNLTGRNLGQTQAIKQMTAAGRGPQGAAMDSLAGMSEGTARGLANMEPGLQQMKRRSEQQYATMLQQHAAGDLEAKAQNRANWAGTVGDLGKVALLWKSGYFDAVEENPQAAFGFQTNAQPYPASWGGY